MLINIVIIIVFSISVLSNIAIARNSKNSIKIGMSAAFSGPSSDIGTDLYNGAMSYFNYINSDGGINGRIIKLINYDDGYNPIPALENTLKLIKEDDVILLFSYVGTPTVTRVLPLLKLYSDQNFYLFFPLTGAQPQREPPYNEFVFNFRASYRDETAGLVNSFVSIGRKKIAVFYQADAYGRSGWDGVNRALQKHGISILAEATYKRGAAYNESFKKQVNILRQFSPDAIISIGSYQASAGFIRDLRNDNWYVPVANLSFVGSESMLELLIHESSKTGEDYTINIINSEVVPNYNDASLQVVNEYRKHNQKYNFIGLEGFMNAKLIVEILRRMRDNISRANLKRTVESIKDYDIGLKESISFSPLKHQALDTVYYNSVINGKWVTIQSWNEWKN